MNSNLAYQDDAWEKRREELIDGEVVMMSPRPTVNHSRVASNIFWIFESYLRKRKCTPFADGVDLYLDEKNNFVPDFMVVCDPGKIKPDGVYGAPDLVAEVLSPKTMRDDKTRKKDAYARAGVREYWIVSPGDKSIEVYRTGETAFVLHDIYTLHPDWQIAKMSEEERSTLVTQFKCSLFDDLDISLEDIFYRIF